MNHIEGRKHQGRALEPQQRCGVLVPWPLICSHWATDAPQASLLRGADLPVLAAALRYSVCTCGSWQRIAQCLRGGPCPGCGPTASSVIPSWEEGRKEGLQLRRNCSFEEFSSWDFFLSLILLEGVEMFREASKT